MKKILTNVIKFEWMLKKRKTMPDTALELVCIFRMIVRAYWEILCAQVSPDKQVNNKRVCEALSELKKAGVSVSLRTRIFTYNCQAQDFMEMSRYSDLAALIRTDPSPLGLVTQDCIQDTNMRIIEGGILRFSRDCITKV